MLRMVGPKEPEYRADDITWMVNVLDEVGITATRTEAAWMWEQYSESYAAGWLVMGRDPDAFIETLLANGLLEDADPSEFVIWKCVCLDPDSTLATVERLESALAFYKRGVEAYRYMFGHEESVHRNSDGCDVCAWEAEAKKREVE